MRTVTLEILRNGPVNNQLLSPLIQYLVLCGNLPASTLTLPFAHQEFLLRMQGLKYRESGESRELEVAETARTMGGVLADIPGLIRELKGLDSSSAEVIHLRLILSPNELALLPFELSLSPPGCPGAGEPIILQTQSPICLTREVRRVASQEVSPIPEAKGEIRILFAAASPPGVGTVPLQAHLLALRQAIDPWLWAWVSDRERHWEVGGNLTVLPQATLAQIERACATGSYTHVHILAHGKELQKPEGSRFALALHGSAVTGEPDYVEGNRLALALRPRVRRREGEFARPLVVSLATCSGGEVGSVVGASASIAHDLHQEGIPFVVASQFPLSFAGSIVLTEVFYREILWGSDPRLLLVELRRALWTKVPGTHDWGSLVSYVSLPATIEEQLARFRPGQAYRALVAAINHFDRALGLLQERDDPGQRQSRKLQGILEQANGLTLRGRRMLREVRERSEIYFDTTKPDPAVDGLFASAEKRLAEALWRLPNDLKGSRTHVDENRGELDEIEANLRRSKVYYRRAFEADTSQSWGLVQALALEAVLEPIGQPWKDDWEFAYILSQRSLKEDNPVHRAWACSSLLELSVLALASDLTNTPFAERLNLRPAEWYAGQLLEIADPERYEVRSTRRQLIRYEFFNAMASKRYRRPLDACEERAKAILEFLKDEPQQEPGPTGGRRQQ